MFNRVEVGRVWRQEQQRGPSGLDELRRLRRRVKGCVVHDDEVLGIEARAQPCLEPGVEDHRITRPLEQQWFFESSIYPGRNQRGPGPSMPGDQAIHPLPLRGIPVPPRGRRGKAAFVDVDRSLTAANKPLPQAQKVFSLLRITLAVPDPFFYGSRPISEGRSRYHGERPGNAAPVPLESARDAPPHAGVRPPNLACEALVARDAWSPVRQV